MFDLAWDAPLLIMQKYIVPAFDILLVAYLIYLVLLWIRGTRAAPMLWGLSIIVGVFFLSQFLGFVTLNWLLGKFLGSIFIIVVILFQEEIRRFLTKMGVQQIFYKTGSKTSVPEMVDDLVYVAHRLGERKIGALIAIQRKVGLADFLEDSTELDAIVGRRLLYTIFIKDSPLHDGAVVIVDGRIKAAGCVLPLSFNPDLDPNLGTRHRAGLGLSERCDAIIIVVSEETGSVTVMHDGQMMRNLDQQTLKDILLASLSDNEKKSSSKETDV